MFTTLGVHTIACWAHRLQSGRKKVCKQKFNSHSWSEWRKEWNFSLKWFMIFLSFFMLLVLLLVAVKAIALFSPKKGTPGWVREKQLQRHHLQRKSATWGIIKRKTWMYNTRWYTCVWMYVFIWDVHFIYFKICYRSPWNSKRQCYKQVGYVQQMEWSKAKFWLAFKSV